MSKINRKQALLAAPLVAIIIIGLASGAGYYFMHQPSYRIQQALRSTLSSQQQVQINESISTKLAAQPVKLTRKGTQGAQGAFDLQFTVAAPTTAFHAQSADGKKIYVNGTGLGNLPALFQPAGDTSLAALAHAKPDQWYEIDHNFLSVLPPDPLHFLQLRLNSEDAKKFDDTYAKQAFIDVEKTQADASVHNQLSHRYTVKLNAQKLAAFIKAYAAAKPQDPTMLAALQAIKSSGQSWNLSVGTKSHHITQATLPISTDSPIASDMTPQDTSASLAVATPPAVKSLPQLQSEYDAEVAAAAAAAKAKAAKSSASSSSVSSSAGFDTWAQEYNFTNYILPTLWR